MFICFCRHHCFIFSHNLQLWNAGKLVNLPVSDNISDATTNSDANSDTSGDASGDAGVEVGGDVDDSEGDVLSQQ